MWTAGRQCMEVSNLFNLHVGRFRHYMLCTITVHAHCMYCICTNVDICWFCLPLSKPNIFLLLSVLYVSTVQNKHSKKMECSSLLLHFPYISCSRIHERTISLRFLGIILKLLKIEVSLYDVYITNHLQTTFAHGGKGWGSKIQNPLVEVTVNSKEEKS